MNEPSASGQLDVGDRQLIHWQMYGDRAAKPAVVLDGGPGSGRSPGWRRLFDASWRHTAFLRDGELLDGVARLSGVPGVLVHGDADLSGPLGVPWALSRAWEGCELTVVPGAIHGLGDPGVKEALRAALTRFGRF